MVMQRDWGLALGLAVALAVTAGKMSVQAAEPYTNDKATLGKGKRAEEFIAAFEKGDAKALVAFWTENGDYVDETGREFKGRAAVQKMYEKFFAANKRMKLKIIVTSARTVGPDVAIEDGITEVTPAGGGLPSAARFSAVLVKRYGEWYFESVRDSVPQPPSNAEHFEDLEWLLGDLKQIGLALHNYVPSYNYFPPAYTLLPQADPGVGTKYGNAPANTVERRREGERRRLG